VAVEKLNLSKLSKKLCARMPINDVLDFGGHLLPLRGGRFFKRRGFSTATLDYAYWPAPVNSSKRVMSLIASTMVCGTGSSRWHYRANQACSEVPHRRILFFGDYMSVKRRRVLMAYLCSALTHLCHLRSSAEHLLCGLNGSWGGLFRRVSGLFD
jgi:hypothetical protein